jgi:hypothetical protein
MKIGKPITKDSFRLILLLLFGLILTAWNIDFSKSAFNDEAYHILLGHQVLNGQNCPGCPYATGSVLIHPILAALGDSIGELYGARAMSMLLGLALTVIIYLTARTLFDGKYSLLSAMMFLFSGTTLYLSKLATYDMTAAFFLGLSFLMIVLSEKEHSIFRMNLWRLIGAAALFLAAITKYLLPVFIPPLLLYVFWKHKFSRALLFFLIPLTVFLLLYAYFAIYPNREQVLDIIVNKKETTRVPFLILTNWTFRWLALSYLLAIFGMFHKEKGKTAIILTILSTPLILLHLITGAEQSVNKNVIFSIIFLSPAAALGANYMVDLYSMKSPSSWVKSFFTVALLAIVLIYGLKNLRWLENQYPDMTPVIEFFKEKGFNNMTVAMNGHVDEVYTYSLSPYYPQAKFISIRKIGNMNDANSHFQEKVDFVVLDDYYGKNYPVENILPLLQQGYILLEDFRMPLSWGVINVKIFGRRSL